MTAIVGILNTQGMAIAADSAATISNAQDVKKVHHKGNKIFTLSKYHPIGIAVYAGATFMDIPWETLIKMYRSKLNDTFYPKVEDYRVDFLKYLKSNIALITKESKSKYFYSLANSAYSELVARMQGELQTEITNLQNSPDQPNFVQTMFDKVIAELKTQTEGVSRNPELDIEYESFKNAYVDELIQINLWIIKSVNDSIPGLNPPFNLSAQNAEDMKCIIHLSTMFDKIFENYTGLVFFGYGETEIFPSSHLVHVGAAIDSSIRYKVESSVVISSGLIEANIVPYAQRDVTYSVLTGINPKVNQEVNQSIKKTVETLKDIFKSKGLSGDEEKKINDISDIFTEELRKFTFEKITSPLLEMLVHMSKEDMAELAESLVNVTSLVSKFTETNESVGGPVDVAVVTKGDGFVWIKRKHYFNTELNKNYLSKYYK